MDDDHDDDGDGVDNDYELAGLLARYHSSTSFFVGRSVGVVQIN